jgi:hypothetical protein
MSPGRRGPDTNKHFNEHYLWETPYNAAILETDETQMPCRIYEAIAAAARLLASIGRKDYRALRAAERALQTLKVEWGIGVEAKLPKHQRERSAAN